MTWNQEALEQWAVAAKQKEEDFLAIERYKRADEQKIKELSLQLERLTRELLVHKSKLENEGTETQAKQMELDRIAVEFKDSHLERQTLVNRWQETIAEMKKRDKEINEYGERFAAAKAERTKKETLTNLQRKRLAAQKGENKEVETRSDTLSRVVLRKREEMMIGTNAINDFRGELDSLKNELTTAAESMAVKRIANTRTQQLLEEKRVKLERERQKYQGIKAKIVIAENNTNKAEVNAKLAEEELVQRERDYQQLLATIKRLNDNLIKENQQVFDLKQNETRLKSEITGNLSITKNLESQLNQLDKDAARQQELLYNAEFQIQQIERKIARGLGERSDEEKQSLKKDIEIHEALLEAAKEKRKMLNAQIRKLANEVASLRVKKEDLNTRFSKLSEVLGEKELENKMIEEEIRRDNRELEEMSVLNDLLRLEVRRLRDLLSVKSDAVYSLENRKQQLLLSLEERKQEISVSTDLLKAEFRALSEDKHNITMELRNRQANVERLKARFESIARSDDDKHSQAYYIIQAAQKKEELQRHGDALDQDVRRCEREIRALQITLDHLNARNIAYRESFQKIDVKGDDAEVLAQLEERTKLNKDALFRKKKELQRLMTDFEEDARRLEQVKGQNDKMYRQQEHLSNAKTQVEEEILTQQTQMGELHDRVDKIAAKHRTRVLENTNTDPVSIQNGTLEEKTVKSEVLKDVVQNVLYTLGQLSNEFPEVSDALAQRLQEADLRLPSEPPVKTLTTTARGHGNNNKKPSGGGSTNSSVRGGGPRSVGGSVNGGGSVNSSGSAVKPKTFNAPF
eukprot:gene25163-31589_t